MKLGLPPRGQSVDLGPGDARLARRLVVQVEAVRAVVELRNAQAQELGEAAVDPQVRLVAERVRAHAGHADQRLVPARVEPAVRDLDIVTHLGSFRCFIVPPARASRAPLRAARSSIASPPARRSDAARAVGRIAVRRSSIASISSRNRSLRSTRAVDSTASAYYASSRVSIETSASWTWCCTRTALDPACRGLADHAQASRVAPVGHMTALFGVDKVLRCTRTAVNWSPSHHPNRGDARLGASRARDAIAWAWRARHRSGSCGRSTPWRSAPPTACSRSAAATASRSPWSARG